MDLQPCEPFQGRGGGILHAGAAAPARLTPLCRISEAGSASQTRSTPLEGAAACDPLQTGSTPLERAARREQPVTRCLTPPDSHTLRLVYCFDRNTGMIET